MMFAVIVERGEPWDFGKPMEAQPQWTEHADFVEDLVAKGTIVLGGPLGTDGKLVLHAVQASDEEAVRSALEPDPWHRAGLLRIQRITPWEVRLARDPGLLSRSQPAG